MTQSDSAASAEPRELVRLSTDALREFRDRERARYEAIKARATPFNLARGKPATEPVALANQLLTAVATPEQCWTEDGNDCRNYCGSPQGLIEARRLFAPMLGAPPELVLVANNSSLALMHDALVYALLTGASDGDRKSTRLNSSHQIISYAVFCLKKKKKIHLNDEADDNIPADIQQQ